MKYYFKLSEMDRRKQDILNGKEPLEINLHMETPRIFDDWMNNDSSNWWPVWKYGTSSTEAGEFKDVREAEIEYYANEADEIYCYVHDC